MVANPAGDGRRHEFDPADDAIAGVFALLRESLGHPGVLEDLPDGAVVEFRDVNVRGRLFSLRAVRGGDSDVWTARPSRHAPIEPTRVWPRPAAIARDAPGPDHVVETLRATGPSGQDALDALTRRLIDAMDRGQSGRPAAPGG